MMVMLLPMVASADAVCVDGIWYNLSGTEAEATSPPGGEAKYEGDIIIPASITYKGTEYSVTSIGANALWNCFGLTSVTIPNSVTRIRFRAFVSCI